MQPSSLIASFPSPSESVWHLGPIPLRAYALCIVLGVVLSIFLTDRRLRAWGGPPGAVLDVAIYAIPAGVIGARLYHVFTTPEPYFGDGGELGNIVKVWEGGLGIWGAILGGAVGAWIGCRRTGLPLRVLADALAPALPLAQAVGRLGNWFNQELYGRPTELPWGLEIDIDHRLPGYYDQTTYHPTFLYEALWCLAVALLVWWAQRRFSLGKGRAFALYVMAYVTGRAWIEYLRIDEAEKVLGARLNIWTCLIVFVGALLYFVLRRGEPERLLTDEDGRVRVFESHSLSEPPVAAEPAADADAVADSESAKANSTGEAGEVDGKKTPGDKSATS